MQTRVSVVISTFNRTESLKRLLGQLAEQSVSPDEMEVVVVDDGSREPVPDALRETRVPYALRVIRQKNAGAAAARHAGIMAANGAIVIIVDDDMEVGREFLEKHLAAHAAGATLVLGHIAYGEELSRMPLYERFHAVHLRRFFERAKDDPSIVRGTNVCTGNVSLRRAEYVAAGGFDTSLARSEDRELGVRLEKAGAKLAFSYDAKTTNKSDVPYDTWWRRIYLYGICDTRIAKKHPDVPHADPWDMLFGSNPLSRPFMLLSAFAPPVGKALSRAAMATATRLDRLRADLPVVDELGAERVAIAGVTLAYSLEYFRGVRAETGSARDAARDLRRYRKARALYGRKAGLALPSEPLRERHAYVDVRGARLYTVTHDAVGPSRGVVVLAGPLGLERTHGYVTWVRWARQLAKSGFDVVRFDYRGVGESEGRFEEMTLDAWADDLGAAIEVARKHRKNSRIVLMGLRLGGILASRAFAAGEGDALLVWDPIPTTREMLLDILRRKLAADYAEKVGSHPASGGPRTERKTREQYVADIEAGRVVEVEGYPWSRAQWASAAEVKLAVPGEGDARPWKMIHLDGRPPERVLAPGGHGASVRVPRPAFWLDSTWLSPDLGELFAASAAWLDASFPRSAS